MEQVQNFCATFEPLRFMPRKSSTFLILFLFFFGRKEVIYNDVTRRSLTEEGVKVFVTTILKPNY